MQILSKKSLALGGFAGLREVRLVTDSRLFGSRKKPETAEGLGQFVYLADASFNPLGETGMHPHKEIDVISIMIDGRVSHEGSLEHGKGLEAGDVQVQRAGGEGFSHNELNPDDTANRMIQLWALPDEAGQPAGYKYYSPKAEGVTRIYGGDKSQSETFDSQTAIDIIHLSAGKSITLTGASLSYITAGSADYIDNTQRHRAEDGDLIRGHDIEITAHSDISIIAVSQIK
ncbi:MAG: pirin family protein [Pseudomonadales bacterium]|nr:pirin family protein [Pseudomonadales bacterium]